MSRGSESLNRNSRQIETDRLRRAWFEGLESGPFDSFDTEAIKQKARTGLARFAGPDQCL